MTAKTKRCGRCGEAKPENKKHFYRKGVGKHHRQYFSSYCIPCENGKRSADRGYKPRKAVARVGFSNMRMVGAGTVL